MTWGSAPERNDEPPPARSYWPIGFALLALVLAVLGAAFVLDRQLRPRVDVQPAVPAAAEAVDSVAPTQAPTAVRSAPPAAPPPSAEGSVTPGRLADDPRLVQEIEDAYRRYWEVYSAALFNLDTSRLAEVAADDELRRLREEIEDFRRRNRAVRAVVTHDYLVVDVTATEATIYDEIRDSSFLIDPVTKNPPQAPDPRHLVKDIFHLKKVDGTWKVHKHLRQEG
ncbi:MAG TPA: hypothetical protein VFE37_20160 [Chloroflexota bacterium]|nr:hypothetical protein [Chloroflexota bacterium]